MRQLFIAMLCCSLWSNSYGQAPTFDWAFATGGQYGVLHNRSIAVDDFGNIYTIGRFHSGPVDFDPGSKVFNLSAVGGLDIYVSKYDTSGNLIWAKRFGGTEDDDGSAIAVDSSGNIYFTGSFEGVADFNPGTEVYNLTSNGSSDIFVCKLDPDGNFLWAKQMGGTAKESGKGITVDGSGNVYVTGDFESTVDFDPGTGTNMLTSNGKTDLFICKFNTAGDFQWVRQIGAGDYDRGEALHVDSANNIFITGSFTGTVDFDPGAGVDELTSTGATGFVLKLNEMGNFEWATKLSNNVTGYAIALDTPGNIYVGGGGPGIGIIKLNAEGDITWDKFLIGSNSNATSIAVDALGNVYTTGSFRNKVDFDPGEGMVIFDTTRGWDSYLNKLDASGNYVWAYQLGEPNFHDYGRAIALDASGSIYASGYFRTTIDFDPGPNTFNLTSESSYNAYLLKWNQETAGLEDQLGGMQLTMYPNPTKGNFHIEFNGVQPFMSVRIFSISGQLLMETQFQNIKNIPLEIQHPDGIYILELSDDKGRKTTVKLVKY